MIRDDQSTVTPDSLYVLTPGLTGTWTALWSCGSCGFAVWRMGICLVQSCAAPCLCLPWGVCVGEEKYSLQARNTLCKVALCPTAP